MKMFKFLRKGLTVRDVIPQFMQSRRDRNLRDWTITNYKSFCDRMLELCGDRPMTSLDTKFVRNTLNARGRTEATYLLVFVRWAKYEDYLPSSFTIKQLPAAPRSDEAEIDFLRPKDAHLYLLSVDPEWRPAFALALFAGVRPMEVCRMQWKFIHLDDERIRIPGWVSKVRRARLLEGGPGGLPSTVWPWLRASSSFDGPVIPVGHESGNMHEWTKARSGARRRSGVTLSHDILRHTFATYHVALTGSPSYTARLLGHTKLHMLAAHYDGVASRSSAEQFFDPSFRP